MALIGRLNKRIDIDVPAFSQNDSAGQEVDYVYGFSLWANVKNVRNYKADDSGIVGLEDQKKVTIRKTIQSDSITKNHLIRIDGDWYVINGIERANNENFYYELTCNNRGKASGYNSNDKTFEFDYYGMFGETVITDVSLINKKIIQVSRDGISVEVVDVYPGGSQVQYDSTGSLTFGTPLNTNEWIHVIYADL